MKRFFLLAIVLMLFSAAKAQVDNYSLRLSGTGTVNSGRLPELNGLSSYTVQFWMCPSVWTNGASLFQRGEGSSAFSVTLGNSGEIYFQVGNQVQKISHSDLKTSTWSQVSIVVSPQGCTAWVNKQKIILSGVASMEIPASDESFVLGKQYTGRIDEFRLWKDAVEESYLLCNNTLNKLHPNYNDLIVYYKFDQNQCTDVVDYTFKHHGKRTGDAVKELVNDNALFKYRILTAYGEFSRFFDRPIARDEYLLCNDLLILGLNAHSDGTVTPEAPASDGILSSATHLASWAGRDGVISFNGSGAQMNVGMDALGATSDSYSFSTWLYLDNWTEGAYLIKREKSDTQGFSLRLGNAERQELIVRINGVEGIWNNSVWQYHGIDKPGKTADLKVGQWVYVAVTTATAISSVRLGINGVKMEAPNVDFSSALSLNLSKLTDTPALIGVNLSGKMDETCMWNIDYPNVASIMNYGIPLPVIGANNINAENVWNCSAYYKYDIAENPGHDYYSYKEFLRIMRSAFNGYKGFKIRMSVRGFSDGMNGCASAMDTEEERQRFGKNIAKAAEEFDGVDLDFEWIYNGASNYYFDNYGKLMKVIRENLSPGKIFTVSPHYVSCRYPSWCMQYVDYFLFQIYGPSTDLYTMSTYRNAYNRFVTPVNGYYGFPKEKIVMSYATTTSSGFLNGVATAPENGYRNLCDENYTPDMNVVVKNGYTYYLTGYNQVRERAEFVNDNNLGGIMYWNLGNDVPSASLPYSLPRSCSYALASNVDTLLTDADIMATSIETEKIKIKANQVSIYPNPVKEFFTVEVSEANRFTDLMIFDSKGMLIDKKSFGQEGVFCCTYRLPSIWSKGLYFLKLKTVCKNVLTSTFII